MPKKPWGLGETPIINTMSQTHMDINKLPFDRYKEGFNIILDNAEALLNSGYLLFKHGNYGLATSVFILACEESIKAFAVYNKLLIDDNRDIRPVFKSHAEKLHILKAGYHLMMAETLAMNESFDRAYEESVQGRKTPDEEINRKAGELYPEILEEKFNKADGKDDTWWDSANISKQNGFYVEYKEGNWSGPNSIVREQAEEAARRALYVVNHITTYRDVGPEKFKSVKSEEVGFKVL